jgi:hypothetical protein
MRSAWYASLLPAALASGLLVLLVPASSAQAPSAQPPRPDFYVSAAGSDAGRCSQSAPCATFNRAYRVAGAGDVVEVAAGTYPPQQIDHDPAKRSAEDVVFRPPAGARVTVGGTLAIFGSHVTVERIGATEVLIAGETASGMPQADVTVRNADAATVEINSATNVRILGGDYGPSEDANSGIRKGSGSMPGNIVIDGATFHDYRCAGGVSCHTECLIVGAVNGLTIRNSRFRACAIYNIFFQAFNGPISRVTLENNWFSAPTGPDGQGVWPHAVRFSADYTYENILVRGNSFAQSFAMGGTAPGSQLTRNIGRFDPNDPPGGCARISSRDNLWENASCGPTDRSALFGYEISGGALRPVRAQAAAIAAIFGQARAGRSLAQISRDLRRARAPAPPGRRWDLATLRQVLSDATYLGGRYGPKGAHPALIRPATWRLVQRRLRGR